MGDSAGLSYHEIILDSRDSSYPYDPSFSALDYPAFTLGGKLKLVKIAYMKILEASIPFTYYVINTDNNTFTLSDGTYTGPVVIAPGTYSPTDMITELTAKLNAVSGLVYTVTANASNRTFTISTTGPFTLTFVDTVDSLAFVLGFVVGANSSVLNVLQGSVEQLLGSNFVYINSNSVGNQVNLFLPQGSSTYGNGGPQMAMVPVTGSFGSNIIFKDPCSTLWFDMQEIESLTKLDLFVVDGVTHKTLKFNGRGFSVKIGVLLSDTSTADRMEVGRVGGSKRSRQ